MEIYTFEFKINNLHFINKLKEKTQKIKSNLGFENAGPMPNTNLETRKQTLFYDVTRVALSLFFGPRQNFKDGIKKDPRGFAHL